MNGPRLTSVTPEQRQMVEANVPLAMAGARRLKTRSLTYEEKLSACALGLFHAARAFDPSKGSFAHYAWLHFRVQVQRDIRLLQVVHVAAYAQTLIRHDQCDLPSSELGPPEVLDVREELRQLAVAIERLPRRIRYIIRQVDIAGQSVRDVALELGLSHERVRQLRHEGLAMLRETTAE